MVFSKAGPAEILRAAQKDDLISKNLQSMVTDVVLRCGGSRVVIQYKTWIEALGYLIYYGNTTLSGLQTLGEEYTGIIQVDSTLRALPPFLVRLVMLILDCFGAVVVFKLLSVFEKRVKNNKEIQPKARAHLLEFLSIVRVLIPFFSHAHKALFYCIGGTYHLAKRLTGINYVLMRYWLKDRESVYGFRILGTITTVHLLCFGAHAAVEWWRGRRESVVESGKGSEGDGALPTRRGTAKCSLCLETVLRPALTPCGHLYCWQCIHEWLQSQHKCPLCREDLYPSRVVPLTNYV